MKRVFQLLLASGMILGATSSRAEITNGLILHYDFDDAFTTNVVDQSGSGYDGAVVSGLSQTAGVVGSGAADFDGVGWIDVGNHAGLDMGTNTMSFSFWVKSASLNGGYIVSKSMATSPYLGYGIGFGDWAGTNVPIRTALIAQGHNPSTNNPAYYRHQNQPHRNQQHPQ